MSMSRFLRETPKILQVPCRSREVKSQHGELKQPICQILHEGWIESLDLCLFHGAVFLNHQAWPPARNTCVYALSVPMNQLLFRIVPTYSQVGTNTYSKIGEVTIPNIPKQKHKSMKFSPKLKPSWFGTPGNRIIFDSTNLSQESLMAPTTTCKAPWTWWFWWTIHGCHDQELS